MPPKKKYRVKPGDSYASLNQFGNPQDLMTLNPGVPTLSPGQDMWVPNPNNRFRPPAPPTPTNFSTANSFISNGMVNTGAFNVGAPQINSAFLNQPEFMSPGGVNRPQSVLGPLGLSQYQQSERTLTPLVQGANSFQSGASVNTQSNLQSLLSSSAAPALNNGQYINNQGAVAQGATPFGVNAAGQRLDVNGNVFDPATAQRDIYGGRFVQEGETRWTRDSRGRVVRQVATNGGWRDVNRRRGAPFAQGREEAVAAVAEVPAVQGNMVNSALSWRVG